MNLQGLAIASSATDTSSLSVCDPLVTHRVNYHDNVWVPRVLMVDEAQNLYTASSTATGGKLNQEFHHQAATTSEVAHSTWGGVVEELNMNAISLENFTNVDTVVSNFSFNSNIAATANTAASRRSPEQDSWLSSWQQASSQLAYAPYSPYRVKASDSSQYYKGAATATTTAQQEPSSTSRHVDWDDLGEEGPGDGEEEQERVAVLNERQQNQKVQLWNAVQAQQRDQLSKLWGIPTRPAAPSVPQALIDAGVLPHFKKGEQEKKESSAGPSEDDLHSLTWMDYWMPPRPSPLTDCTYGLPSASAASALEAPALHAFNIATNGSSSSQSSIILEDIWEKIRMELERTDACEGFHFVTEGSGIYAGITDWLLQELQQECRAAGRWVFQIHKDENENVDDNDRENSLSQRRTTQLARAQARIREQVQHGLAVSGLSDKAHALVPLVLPSRNDKSLFRSSAELAMVLETAMLPYRCRASTQSNPITRTLVGWNSMNGYEEGAPPGSMSLGDYLTTVQPSSRYSLLELDAVMTPRNRLRLGQVLAAGTSVERDPRVRPPASSAGLDLPGAWMLDEQFGINASTALSPGILTSLSPNHVSMHDRSLHHHFGLSTCLRRITTSDSPVLTTNQQHLTCMMEGMGIRYRPETAFGLVTAQSLTQLATMGQYSGAGSYWQYLFRADGDVPVLSVLGNTTRMYPHLHIIAKDMKAALSLKSKGYYQREVASGTLPELDDCDEAIESCLDLRDTYEPPSGSGLVDGDGDLYFDD